MKRNLILAGAVTAIFALTLTSCKKDKKKGCTSPTATNYDSSAEEDDGSCTEPTPTAAQPSGYTPTFTGTYGVLVGINTISTVDPGFGLPVYDLNLGTAVAFFTENGGSTMVDAGAVSLSLNSNNYGLTKQSNNSYSYIPQAGSTTGIDFSNVSSSNYATYSGVGATWPSFSLGIAKPFSTISEITSGDVTVGSSYSIAVNTISGADSIYFALHSPTGSKYIMKAGNFGGNYTFTSAETSGLGKGNGYVQVVGISYKGDYPFVVGGKNYYVLNETVRTKMVQFK